MPLINGPNSGFADLCRRVIPASTWAEEEGGEGPSEFPGARLLQKTAVTLGEFLSFFNDRESHFTSFDKGHFAKMAKLNHRAVRRAQIHHSGPYQL